ncbi:MAG: metallophosphoesterase [Bacillota bacterium]|jgi:predicted phosphohydrolase
MAIYGISDLHLSLTEYFSEEILNCCDEHKPMHIFGAHWENHTRKIFENWNSAVSASDTVLVPGDLSWAMHMKDAVYDFDFLSRLQGRLLICRGNHDYWWDTKAKICQALPENVIPLQNESFLAENVVISATRGWICPGSKDFKAGDEKIYRRELIRLEMALQHGKKLQEQTEAVSEHWVMLHYRPTNDEFSESGFTELMQKYGVTRCFYGHLHGNPCYNVLQGERFGIDFQLLSCDYLHFKPLKLK